MANKRISVMVVVGLFVLGITLVSSQGALPVSYASTAGLLQKAQTSRFCATSISCALPITFASDVSSGNVVVVGVIDYYPLGSPSISVTDSRSSSYSLASTVAGYGSTVSIYDTTLSSSGPDTITVTDSSGNSELLAVFAFEVFGVTTASAPTATGSSHLANPSIYTGAVSTSSTVSFKTGAFLLAVVDSGASALAGSAGTGFTYFGAVSVGLFSEYATSGVSSPTSFSASVSSATYFDEAGIALQPAATSISSQGVGLVQEGQNGLECVISCTTPITFASDVTSGDVVVVGAVVFTPGGGGSPSLSVTDSRSSSYSLASTVTDYEGAVSVFIYDTTLSSSGPDTVAVTVTNPANFAGLFASAFEVVGVTTTSAPTATSSFDIPTGGYTGTASTSSVPVYGAPGSLPCGVVLNPPISYCSGPVSFKTGAFLLSVVGTDDSSNSGGTGFSYFGSSGASSLGLGAFTEYATSGVSSPTSFPVTLSGNGAGVFAESGIALEPTSSTTTSSTSSTKTVTSTVTSTITKTSTLTSVSTSTSTVTVPITSTITKTSTVTRTITLPPVTITSTITKTVTVTQTLASTPEFNSSVIGMLLAVSVALASILAMRRRGNTPETGIT